MPAVLCWFCNKVKGKRVCPARGGALICSRCCGTKRRVEIRCPEDCPYLHGKHDPRWESRAQESEHRRFVQNFARLDEKQAAVLAYVHVQLLNARNELGGQLTDQDAAEVVSTLTRTYETRSKGVLYEHTTESLKLQGVVRRLSQAFEDRESGRPQPTDGEMLAALESLKKAIAEHLERAGGGRSYLDLAARLIRSKTERPSTARDSEPRLIVEP